MFEAFLSYACKKIKIEILKKKYVVFSRLLIKLFKILIVL
jgi:hypothetical protein